MAAWAGALGNRPFARRFLNEPIVLFRDASGTVAALASETPVPTSMSPALGEGNDRFYRDELGLSADEIAALRERKVI